MSRNWDEPWKDEPDQKQWTSSGLLCEVKRHPRMGHLCGYVDIPPGHPCHGLGERYGLKGKGLPGFDVHGGITWEQWKTAPWHDYMRGHRFSDDRIESPLLQLLVKMYRKVHYHLREFYVRFIAHRNDPWRIGFDCAHAWDRVPGREALDGYREWDATYRDFEYVVEQTNQLAAQVRGYGLLKSALVERGAV